MKLFRCVSASLLVVSTLILAEGFCAENGSEPNHKEESNDSSSSNGEASPSVAETIIEIANDPGAGCCGDR